MGGFFVSLGGWIASLWVMIWSFLPIGFTRISTEPVVFDGGSDYYAVVWATSTKGSGCVKYTYNGEEKTVWDSVAGTIRTDDTVHSVLIPKEELQGNTYKVVSQYVGFKFGYNAGKGQTVESKEYSFGGIPKEDGIKVLVATDIHEMESEMKKALKYFESETPDMILMLGDITSTSELKSQFANNFLSYAHTLSKGEIPIAYTRGNHETRGEFAAKVLDYIPTETDGFYMTFEFGSLGAIVLDSGEDKDDNHQEYSGLVNFEEYRNKEYKWLTSLEKSEFENNRYTIAFCHNPNISDHFGMDWLTPLANLDADLLVGGHYHKSEFKDDVAVPTLYAGGKLKTGTGIWSATMLTLENDTIHMVTIDNGGNTILDRTINTK